MLRVSGRISALALVVLWTFDGAAQAPASASFPEADSPAAPAPAPAPAPPAAAASPAPTPPVPVATPVAPAPAIAEPPLPEAREEPKRRARYVSLTISPLHLLNPVFELELEAMITPHFGAGLIGGIGSIKAESNDPLVSDEKFSAYELGLQLIGYPLQDFSSLQLGAELLWLKVSAENLAGREISANAGGVALGPFIGYKLLTDVGFTFFVQGGFQYMAVKAEASDTAGNSAQNEQETIIPLVNLNLGWSF